MRRQGARAASGGGPAELPEPIGLLIEPDGRHAWVSSTRSFVICRIDLATLAVSGSLAGGSEPDALAGRWGQVFTKRPNGR